MNSGSPIRSTNHFRSLSSLLKAHLRLSISICSTIWANQNIHIFPSNKILWTNLIRGEENFCLHGHNPGCNPGCAQHGNQQLLATCQPIHFQTTRSPPISLHITHIQSLSVCTLRGHRLTIFHCAWCSEGSAPRQCASTILWWHLNLCERHCWPDARLH